ncbi:phospholipase D family protein [Paenibacillus popilliae]|uniref:NgoFVII family restriction endonuclease n=1 Tax=Paenibacillus popilliae TaxID=78057 RepID=A0ABY3AIG1_PAEPP|nr:phospholipase D family protein [Paenibacillus sp. SDF0028]TQR40176.1 NgoFVII family restriction endonuclease [Paenibacillus sp. SDF0028]
MPVSLVSNDLLDRFNELLKETEDELNIISPFIGTQTAALLADWLIDNSTVKCNIITRFYREDFVERVSSIYGLERLLHAKAKIYALIDLHSKLYSFDAHSVIIGSANFTQGGFLSNHEVCVIMDDEPEITEKANEYLYDLLDQIQLDGNGVVTQEWIDEEKNHVSQLAANRRNRNITYSNILKKGATLKKIVHPDLFESILENSNNIEAMAGIWLKFEGTGEDRIPNDYDYKRMKGDRRRTLNTTYFPRKPGSIQNGDTLFLTIVSYDEQNRPTPMIVGYAKSDGFKKDNVVNESEIKDSPWKHRFPYFVEFTSGKVINAPIKYGVRLVDLYNTLGKTTFPSLRKRKSVSQRTLQSMHYRRSHIRITQEAYDFLMNELNKRFRTHGEITL